MDTFLKKPTSNILFLKSKEIEMQGKFLKRIGTLLCEGLSLKETIAFLQKITDKKQKNWLDQLEKGIRSGQLLHLELKKIGFSERVCTQIYLSTIHGDFAKTIKLSGEQLIDIARRKKKIQSILQYPLMLLLFITVMLFSMRYVLMPHIQRIATPEEVSVGIGTRLIMMIVYTAPYWLIGSVICISGFVLTIQYRNQNKTAVEQLNLYCKNRLFKKYIQLYWTQFYAFEWSQLLKSNSSMNKITQILKEDESAKLSREVGSLIESEMLKGNSFQAALQSLHFFKNDLGEIIQHGEQSGKLDSELMLYASECEDELNDRIERMMGKIQPIVFVFVALMIIAIYAALLLPTFSIMEGL
ncbi:competence type IV pilus assembly protein ComGB [Marinilactibacillus kalidii]|uniref:competence type IV pilus assembly protein ComGB n=1 Tax=Marinilactibacillus kalidii TaxID=2820274 RepID=UPI001ABE6F88|nr:competence type IV pilus assembly protein ComGB [Marinilactibacillus kalidii]